MIASPTRARRSSYRLVVRAVLLAAVLLPFLGLLPGAFAPRPVSAHNLQTRMVYMFLDPATQALLDARIEAPGWMPPDPLLQANDEIGLIIKVVPRDGTTTGVGGHVDFYVPNGVQVLDAAYVIPDGSGGFSTVAMKGQSPIAIGSGPIGAKATSQLIGMGPLGPNVLGVTENPVVPASGLHRGTIAGVYGDTGIFYSTDPDTAYGSWQTFTGDWNANQYLNKCGSTAFTTPNGKTLTNNSGDTVVPCNKWDAEQLFAWGVKGTTYAGAGASSAPIVDYGDGRGNAPWGHASGVAGPESGYKWNFDWDEWAASAKDAAAMQSALANDEVGPWQRIKYAGSRISKDEPGLVSTVLGFANVDGGTVGRDLVASPLPDTVSQLDTTSPKVIRWAVGQLTAFRPEYVWVKFKIKSAAAEITDPSGCPVFKGDTFGGDAGGTDNGKDHLWRYYEPTEVTWNGCLAAGKPSTREIVKVGDTFQYKLKVYNFQNFTLSSVVVRDTLPSGVSFISAVPAQNSGPNPLQWNVGTLLPGQKFEATVTVKATGSGFLDNKLEIFSTQLPPQTVIETIESGAYPYLVPSKTVSPLSVAPGGTVQYTVRVDNTGTGPTASPVSIQEYLPTGFTFLGPVTSATVNGASVTPTVNTANPNQPLFTIASAINAGQSLVLTFMAQVPSGTTGGNYCNSYTVTQNGIPLTTGSLACVDVGGGTIGDTIFRDWDGDGVRDPEDEGLSGVVVELQNGVCTPSVNCPTTTTNASGFYQFTGLLAGNYTVKVLSGVPAGYTLTYDPVGAADGLAAITLATNEKRLDVDFGYRPGGTGSVGDKVFDDKNDDGTFNGTDAGIPNVTVRLYEDTNGNGVIDAGVDALVATTSTDGSGNYLFSGLATGIRYIADVDQTDPDINTYFVGAYGSATGVVQTTTDPHVVGVLSGAYLAADFGFYKTVPGSIGDMVFIDTNSNGVVDAGEAGLANVTVKLYQDTNGNGRLDPGEPLLQTTSTNSVGFYTFTGLPAGNYVVDVDQADTDVPSFLFPSRDPIATSLTQGQQRTDVDFPFVQALSKAVSPTGFVSPVGNPTLTYTIVPRVPGETLLDGVVVNDIIPAGSTYKAASVTAGGVAEDTDDPPDGIIDVVTWELGSNAPGTLGFKGGTPPTACQTTLTVEANADAWLFEKTAESDENYGTDNELDTSNRTAQDKATLLRFGTIGAGAIPAGAVFNSAQLQVTTAGGAGANRQVEVHELLTTWTEGTGNGAVCTAAGNGAAWQGPNCTDAWLTGADAFGTSDFGVTNLGTINPTANGTTYTADVSTPVASWLAGGTNRGLTLWPVGTDTGVVNWHSREASGGSSGLRPKIVITYTPNGCDGSTTVRDTGANEVPDSYIQEDSGGDDNFGTLNRLKNRPESGKRKHSLVKFSLSAVPAGVTIESATMSLNVQTAKTNQVHEVHRLLTAWVEGTSGVNGVQWNDPNGTGTPGVWASGVFSASDYSATSLGNITPSSTGVKTLNITGQVQNWYSGLHPNNGVVLLSTGTSTADSQYYSSEEGTETRRPTLTINWSVPPSNPNGTNTIKATGMVVQNGDPVTVKQTLTDSSGVAVTNVAPSAVVITGANGANASCGSPTPATQTVPANGSATFTRTCTITSVGATPGTVKFASSATNGTTTWSSATSNGVIVSPVLTFQVTVNNPPGVNVVTNQATLEDANIQTLTSNPTDTPVTSSIGDRVWIDANANGVQDAGEGNVAGVRVYIDANNNGVYDVGEAFDITDANGSYRIGGLTNGTYNVRMDITTLPSGFYPTTATQLSRTITAAGQQITDADFGVASGTGKVGDLVWLDANENGVFDVGETPLAGVVVYLYNDVDNSGTVNAGDVLIGTRITDANGNYLFDKMYTSYAGGNVNLLVDVISGLPSGVELVGGGTDPRDVTLSNGAPTVLTADFPYNYGGSIGDFAWYDLDGDGIQDGGAETGAPNTTIVLYVDTNANGQVDPGEPVYAVTVTDANGAYLFDNLPPGNYVVKADEQQVPAPPSSANAGQIGQMVASTGSSVAVSLAPNQHVTTADFGFVEAAEVEGHVFHDVNHNGIKDGEAGIANVTVTLDGTDIFGNPVSLITTTNGSGEYTFIVPPGTYTVTYDTADTDIPAALSQSTTPTSATFSIVAGAEQMGPDFGRDNPGQIGDRVWLDSNGDGIQTVGEPGLGGVTVQLYLDTDGNTATTGDQVLLDSLVTDANGAYHFLGLADTTGASKYVVKIVPATLPSGYTATGEGDPGTGCGGGCDNQIATALVGGATISTIDFGYKPPVTSFAVSGRVWRDDDANGSQGGGEPGLGGIKVCLYDATGTTAIQCTTTTASGDYSFPGVPNGSYVVKVDPTTLPNGAYVQTGDPDASCPGANCNHATPVTVSGASVTGKNFGYDEQLSSIAGTIVQNADGDGLAEPGETPVPNVPVFLVGAGADGIIGTADDVVKATTTNASGDYSFTGLLPGTYVVSKSNPVGLYSLADRDGGDADQIVIDLATNVSAVDQDFELAARGSVGDTVWLDADQDGVRDVGEAGLPNVTVVLKTWGPDGIQGNGDDLTIATTTTDADGNYLFTGVPAGSGYYVDVTAGVPAGLVLTNGRTDPTPTFNLAAGQAYLDADIGYTADTANTKAVIGDFVWSDADSDGVQDPGEPGIAGVTVNLIRASDGVVIATTTTDGSGRYLFTGVAPGEYRVDVTDTNGVLVGYTPTTGPQSATDPSAPILVAAGDVYVNADFGYNKPTLHGITDTVWLDADADGIKDPGELGIPGVTVDLVAPGTDGLFGTADDVVLATAITDANGNVSFAGVPDGTYRLVPTDNEDALDGLGTTTTPAANGYQPVTVAGADVAGTNFGYNALASVGDFVWSDADGDNIQDPGEPGIPGVTVQLWRDANGDGIFDNAVDTLVATVVTDATGHYLVGNLPAGTYFASIDTGQAALTGYTATTPDQETGANAPGRQIQADLANNAISFLAADFGFQKPVNADVSGSIWNDLDRDGVDDGVAEPPIAGVTVALVDANGNVVATTTTNAGGQYTFPDVPPGSYTVVVTDTAGVLVGYDLTSGLDAIPVTVGASNITGVDFGYVRTPNTGSIGDRVWFDADGDGVQDAAEDGLPNVELTLYRDNGDGVFNAGTDILVATTKTDINGEYVFTGLPAGRYFVDVTGGVPAGLSVSPGTTDPSAIIDLSEGEQYPDADFGYLSTVGGALGDRVWYDVDGDGLQDPGEPGIGGVTITVTGPGCAPCVVVTDPDGSWLLTGLQPGGYTVTVTVPGAYNPTPTNGPISRAVTLLPGEDFTDSDFGLNGGAFGSIGDLVWFDTNGNGVVDGGEIGIPGVTVNLVGPGPDLTFGTPDDVILASDVTDAAGGYLFGGLPTGPYRVRVTDVDGVLAGLNLSSGANPTATINLVAPSAFLTADFGYAPSGGSIGNLVWHDLNGNGVRDAGEPGIEGVEVALWLDVDGDGVIDPALDNLIRTTYTDINGNYEFHGLPTTATGLKYIVDVTGVNSAAGGVLAGFSLTSGAANTNDNSQADPYGITLTNAAPRNYAADFGYTAPGAGFTVSGTTFEDKDRNALFQDPGEPRVPGVTVYLYRDLDGDGILDPADPLIGTTVSDANGDYAFTDLPDGTYLVVTDATYTYVDGYLQTTQTATPDPAIQPVTVSGANVVDQDFGFFKPIPVGSVGDTIWLDTDGDGVHDVGEPGLPNVTVVLKDSGGNVVAVALTDSDGHYLFTDVPAGNGYTVDVTTGVPAGLVLSPGSSDPTASFTVTAGQAYLDADVGYTGAPAKAVIGDYVWSDADADGVQDPGESGIGGVTVQLRGPGADGLLGTADDVTVATTVTADDGTYHFTNVDPGAYLVRIPTPPAGYTSTTGGDVSVPIAVAPGDVYLKADFGYDNNALHSISDKVWLDVDGDGTLDPGEPGIPGVTVVLQDASGDIVASTTTGPDGSFTFPGLPDGSYTLVIVDNTDVLGDYTGTTPSATAGSKPVTVAGGDVAGTNFGYDQPGTIGDLVWADADGDGVQDPGEPGLGGVTVLLYRDVDDDGVFEPGADDGAPVASTATAADGSYAFAGLSDGRYFVSIDGTQGALSGYALSAGTPDEVGGQPGAQQTIVLSASSRTDLTADFGYQQPTLADVTGSVWNDLDADGVDDGAGEPPIAGVTVALVDDNGNVVATTTTDANGTYVFPDVPPGDYVVVVTDANGVLQDYTLTSALDAVPVTVPASGTVQVDFGFVGAPATGRIGDTVWLDADGDGAQDAAEAGLGAVTVELWRVGPDGVIGGGDDVLADTTVSDANGNYAFTGLPAGTYYVVVDPTTLPNGGAGLAETTGGLDDRTNAIPLAEGADYRDADLGYSAPAGTVALGDLVWYDLDGDAIQDPGEVGIGGATVTVTGPGCAPCVAVTDPDGSWLVTGLQPGQTYQVVVTPPAGYGTTPTNGSATRTYEMPAAPEFDILYADFGFTRPSNEVGSIGDRVWLDVDGDGVQDAGEPGLGGVTLNLVDGGGDVIATTITAADGSYLFVGVPAGSYTVVVTDLGGILADANQSFDPDEAGACVTCDATASVTVVGGASVTTIDFGYAPTIGSIGNQVWHDLNGNGVFERNGADGLPGTADDETPIQGVVVRLFVDVNGNGIYDPGIDNLVRTTTTDANGQYAFFGTPAESYLVALDGLPGFTTTTGTAGLDDNSQTSPYAVTLSSVSPANVTADFGLVAAGTPHTISGTVFNDTDNDGVLDWPTNDHRIPEIQVFLYLDLDGDKILDPGEPLIASQLTDAIGGYSFPDLPDGNYLVVVSAVDSRLDGYLQTTQQGAGFPDPSIQWVALSGADSTDNDFGFFAPAPPQTTPVTIARFASERRGDVVRFAWTTATEAGNVGFNLYAATANGLKRLNDRLIPTQGMDSLGPQTYEFEAASPTDAPFVIEDVAWDTGTRMHGVFDLGLAYGQELDASPIDWEAIQAESAAKAAERSEAEAEAVTPSLQRQVEDAVRAADEAEAAGSAIEADRSSEADGAAAPLAAPGDPQPVARFAVSVDGAYRVTYEQLLGAGINLNRTSTGQLALVSQGRSVPVRVTGGSRFGPGSAIEFVGRAATGQYTRRNVYDLVLSNRLATSMSVDRAKVKANAAIAPHYMATVTIDDNRAYSYLSPNGDPWYDRSMLTYASPSSWSYPVTLDAVVPGGSPTLTVDAWGVTNWDGNAPDHHLRVSFNGTQVADERFDGLTARSLTAALPAGAVVEGANTLALALPGDTGFDFDMINLDRFSVTYPRRFVATGGRLDFSAAGDAFAVTGLPSASVVVYRFDGDAPVRMENVSVSKAGASYTATFAGTKQPARYLVTADTAVRSPEIGTPRPAADITSGRADYVILAHPDFLGGLQPLVGYHTGRGLRVKVVDVRDVYDQFGGGLFGPEAIDAYAAHAITAMGARFLLLVGGDSYDYLHYVDPQSLSFIPTMYAKTDDIVHFTPTDALFADADGDGLPDAAIGRLPVRTSAELATVLQKTLTYAGKGYGRSAVFAADGVDEIVNFTAQSYQFIGMLPSGWQVARAHVAEVGVAGAKSTLIDRMNQGVALTSYVGHSGPTTWTFQGLLSTGDVAALTNAGKPTVVTQWGCWNTYFTTPRYNTMSHTFLLGGDKGAAAVLGASSLTESVSEEKLGVLLLPRLVTPGATLGESLQAAKRELAKTDPKRLDVLLGWTILGDPALVVQP